MWGLPHGWREHPLQDTGGQVSLSRPEGWPSSPLMPHCDIYESVTGRVFRKTNAGVEICVREVHWGASSTCKEVRLAPGRTGRPMDQLLQTPKEIPGGALHLGHPFRGISNQGKGQGLCNPQRSVLGHGCLGKERGFSRSR